MVTQAPNLGGPNGASVSNADACSIRESGPSDALPAPTVTLLRIRLLCSQDGTRLSRNEAHIAELERDFRQRLKDRPEAHPVHTPLRVIKRGDRYFIVAGNYRYAAGLRVPLDYMPCIILPEDMDDIHLFIEQYRDNAHHENYDRVERARAILHVKEKLGCPLAKAAQLLDIDDAGTATKLVGMLRIPEDLLEKIGEGEGKIPFTSAYELGRLHPNVEKIRELAEKVMRGLLCRDAVVTAVQTILGGGKRVKSEKPVKFRHNGGKGEFPGEWGWDQIIQWLADCQDAAKRGAKMPNAPASYLPRLLKGT